MININNILSAIKRNDPLEITYNEVPGSNYNVYLYGYPEFSGCEKKYNTYPIQGRYGELVSSDNYMTNKIINCVFSILGSEYHQIIRKMKLEWLKGTGTLVFSDQEDAFYKVLKINYGDMERQIRNYGTFSVEFVCDPYSYLKSGNTQINFPSQSITNNYDISHPLYYVSGTGVCTITINGKEFEANVSGSMYIDSDLMISYRDNQNMSTFVTGDYENLWLQNGVNTLSITNGFTAMITPRWRCL